MPRRICFQNIKSRIARRKVGKGDIVYGMSLKAKSMSRMNSENFRVVHYSENALSCENSGLCLGNLPSFFWRPILFTLFCVFSLTNLNGKNTFRCSVSKTKPWNQRDHLCTSELLSEAYMRGD